MACGKHKAMVFDENTLVLLKTININTRVTRLTNPQLEIPLLFAHIIPETDSRFLLEFYDSKLIYLRKIETGER